MIYCREGICTLNKRWEMKGQKLTFKGQREYRLKKKVISLIHSLYDNGKKGVSIEEEDNMKRREVEVLRF